MFNTFWGRLKNAHKSNKKNICFLWGILWLFLFDLWPLVQVRSSSSVFRITEHLVKNSVPLSGNPVTDPRWSPVCAPLLQTPTLLCPLLPPTAHDTATDSHQTFPQWFLQWSVSPWWTLFTSSNLRGKLLRVLGAERHVRASVKCKEMTLLAGMLGWAVHLLKDWFVADNTWSVRGTWGQHREKSFS